MLLQVMQELTEDIDRFPRYHGHLLGFGGEWLPCVGITAPIIQERQDQTLLLEPRPLVEQTSILKRGPGERLCEEIREVVLRLEEIEGEKHVFGLEIAELQQKIGRGFDGTELLPHLRLGLGYGNVLHALVGRERGAPVEGLDFVCPQDFETPCRRLSRLSCHP